ncbi:MAG TPA: DUF4976 domain-containing protein [Pricia antarctica]|uniref:DUF4976 domain-containing protein n=1 Tax=Pricia antarctica TaxID=641691 RepID=A0A831QTJ1_9FLAO|nr:DUF4976 domain-containing protein [Pricia antarctica]
MHFYYDIDTWEFYDLEQIPQELKNSIQVSAYTELIEMMHHKLYIVQKVYKVTDKEFEKRRKKSRESLRLFQYIARDINSIIARLLKYSIELSVREFKISFVVSVGDSKSSNFHA